MPAPIEAVAPARAASPPPSKHFEALDGVRGVAILMVLAMHYGESLKQSGWENWLRDLTYNGYIGVTLFFVLSGFLITRILVQTRDNPSYFRAFYARRTLRIFPLYYAYLAFVFLVYQPLGAALLGRHFTDQGRAWWFLSYLQNLEPRTDRLDDGGLRHLWSLAIEEQFYLVWPLVVYLTPRRWLLPLCGAGFLGSLAYRSHMLAGGSSFIEIYMPTVARVDALLAGAAVGLIELDADARDRLARWLKPLVAACVGGVLYIAATGEGPVLMRREFTTVGWAILAIFFAAVVFWAATDGASSRVLGARWLRLVGKYSYGVYVLHMVPVPIVARLVPTATLAGRLAQISLNLAITAALTMASWHLLEAPFLRLKRKVEYAT